MIYAELLIGLIILISGGELLVRGSISIASHFRLSQIVVGLTIVAFGTSAPELFVSLESVIAGSSGIALGTIVGSNITNILLCLGLPAAIYSSRSKITNITIETSLMIFSGIVLLILLIDGEVGRWDGLIMFSLLLVYFISLYQLRKSKRIVEIEVNQTNHNSQSVLLDLIIVVVGIAALWAGSDILIPAAVQIATEIGVTEKVIGVAMIGVGTSLPELTTALVAAHKKNPGLRVGNIIGSNLFNILGVLGITAIVLPIETGFDNIKFDILAMIGISLLIVPYSIKSQTIGKLGGIIFITIYIIYLGSQFI